MSNFSGPLAIQYDQRASKVLDGDYWRVLKSYRFYLPTSFIGNEWTTYDSNRWGFVSAGFLTDLGTIPKILRSIVDDDGKASQGFVLHDALCEFLSITENGRPKNITREEADLILRAALLELGVSKLQTAMIYDAVRAYALVNRIRDPSSTAIKRRLEAEFNYEDFK